jgi:hypothetical protein
MTDLRKAAEAKAREMGNTRCHHGDGYQFECDDCVADALVEFAEERYDTEEVERAVADARREERADLRLVVCQGCKPRIDFDAEMRRRRESEEK